MKASELIKGLQAVVATNGDLDVELSILKQYPSNPKVKLVLESQQYLVASPQFIVVEKNDDCESVCIRDWPY